MTRVSFYHDERGNPRAATSEADAALASFLREEATGEERVAYLLNLLRRAESAAGEVRENGNASVLVAKEGLVRIDHDYIGETVELTSDEFATILNDWNNFVQTRPHGS